jgi:hypothetical protein
MELNLDNLSKYTEADLEAIEKGIAKEKRRRARASKIRAKLEKQANALGYTLIPKDSERPSIAEAGSAQEESPHQRAREN